MATISGATSHSRSGSAAGTTVSTIDPRDSAQACGVITIGAADLTPYIPAGRMEGRKTAADDDDDEDDDEDDQQKSRG